MRKIKNSSKISWDINNIELKKMPKTKDKKIEENLRLGHYLI
jgi:hypothetical protein